MGHCTLDTDIQTSKSVSRLPEGMSGVAECFRSLKVSTCLRLHNTPILSLLPPSKLLSFLNFRFSKELNCPEIEEHFQPFDELHPAHLSGWELISVLETHECDIRDTWG